MGIQEIKGEDYSIQYDPESVTVTFHGELSLTACRVCANSRIVR